MYYYIKDQKILCGSETELNHIDYDSVIECDADETVVIKDGKPNVIKMVNMTLPEHLIQKPAAVSQALQKTENEERKTENKVQKTETKVPETQSTEPKPEPAEQKPVLSQAETENGEPKLSEEDIQKAIDERVQEQVQAKVKQKMQELLGEVGS